MISDKCCPPSSQILIGTLIKLGTLSVPVQEWLSSLNSAEQPKMFVFTLVGCLEFPVNSSSLHRLVEM